MTLNIHFTTKLRVVVRTLNISDNTVNTLGGVSMPPVPTYGINVTAANRVMPTRM